MQAFEQVLMAEVCWPFEAAEWLALGRLPRAELDDKGNEIRSDIRGLTDEIRFESEPYRRGELEAYGVSIDYDRYIELAYGCSYSSVHELFQGEDYTSRWAAPIQGPPHPALYEDVRFLEAVSSSLNLWEARAELMVRLAQLEGKLTARGYATPEGWTHEDGEWGDLYERAFVQVIPAATWTDGDLLQKLGNGLDNVPGFIGAWIDTQSVINLFPTPLIPPKAISAKVWGETVLIESGSDARIHSTSHRGRPKVAAGAIETAVRNEFRRRRKDGLLPDKREAAIADCIEWVRHTFESDIGRSTAQRYLKPVFGEDSP